MAKNAKKPTKKSSSTDENVVRIKAGASSKRAEKTTTAPASKTEVKEKPAKTTIKKSDKGIRGLGFLSGIGGYFKGAWQELRLVRWPTRGATWSLTFAVLAYSAFFVVLVLLLDAAFKYLFELILGK